MSERAATPLGDSGDDTGYVLLSNQSVLKGTAVQRGNDVVIRRSDGSEIELNRSRVLCWAPSVKDLYQYRIDHRATNTLASHLDDANWCVEHGQLGLAIKELKLIREIDPGNEQAARIQRRLFYAVKARVAATAKTPVASGAPTIDLASHTSGESSPTTKTAGSERENVAEPEADIETLKSFAKRVQPILLNRCGSCHSDHSNLKWKLHLPPHGARPSAAMTRANLAAVQQYISAEVPMESELRLRAMDSHAGKNALAITQSAATNTLDDWLSKARPSGEPLSLAKQAYSKQDAGADKSDPSESNRVDRLPEVENPFDPEIFNRRMQVTN